MFTDLSMKKTIGVIPERMLVCHTCDSPPCCNPQHLFLGTHDDNMRGAWQKRQSFQIHRRKKWAMQTN